MMEFGHPAVAQVLAQLTAADPPSCWAIVFRDEATGALSVTGPYRHELTAVSDMETMLAQVNTGASPEDDPPWNLGWTASVVPCELPDSDAYYPPTTQGEPT